MSDRVCGAIGCTNDAVGTIPHKGKLVWTCRECADQPIKRTLEVDQ